MAHIKIKNVSLDIPVYENTERNLKTKLVNLSLGGIIQKNTKHPVIRALHNIDMEINEGNSLALIGRNGAGKSTLLRVLSGVFTPTQGSVEISGKVSSLLSMGMGVDYELSGYENIFLIGLLLGLTKKQIKSRTQEIIDFTELGEFIKFPVKTYSAGMVIRLTFAIATSIEPEILMLDEGIGAGDTKFVHKAQERAQALYEKTNIMVIASHDKSLIEKFCNKAILLDRGRIIAQGSVDEVFQAYNKL
ncbi:ATP-binding cassette domain-containing protein [Desulfovibrio aerotolerans]|uniref:ATP-binding cassette domain-containing protein n=1 Tax=Solidesulfovibrio aerotolerans TaxID=295255 RepID=A0A7C9IQ94_9BACT|nr:ABC transporter ATP-binding protein [Solidesulfovibrio aerotolerans]MYL85159.1 ATP-binding cassette domain-containing protein [Solidesulfovibrio aerotolerans]